MNKKKKVVKKKHRKSQQSGGKGGQNPNMTKTVAFRVFARIYDYQVNEFEKLFKQLELQREINKKHVDLVGLVKYELTSTKKEDYLLATTLLQELLNRFPGRFDFVR